MLIKNLIAFWHLGNAKLAFANSSSTRLDQLESDFFDQWTRSTSVSGGLRLEGSFRDIIRDRTFPIKRASL